MLVPGLTRDRVPTRFRVHTNDCLTAESDAENRPSHCCAAQRKPAMIYLASSSVSIRIDPRNGGEVLDLIDVRTGRQLLGRPPFASDEPVSGELDEATWTR